jgi:hypothetical protein
MGALFRAFTYGKWFENVGVLLAVITQTGKARPSYYARGSPGRPRHAEKTLSSLTSPARS